MKESVLEYLCCPVTRSSLHVQDAARGPGVTEIQSGYLQSAEGRRYEILDGVPQLQLAPTSADEESTVGSFGREWAKYDDFDGYMGSPELFLEFTGLRQDHIRGRTVLEVGCGGGRWLKVLADLGARAVVGLDAGTSVSQAAQRTARYPNVHVVRGSALNIPLKPSFDLVTSVGVVHHLADPVLGLKNMRQVTLPNHLVAFWVYAREGNELYLSFVRPLRSVTTRMPDGVNTVSSKVLAAFVWVYANTVNRLAAATNMPLPLRDYLVMLRRLRFRDIESVVYDQLTPCIAAYPTRDQVVSWVSQAGGHVERLFHRTGNSWQCHCRFERG
jgi:SAM-dependent methyltransferase